MPSKSELRAQWNALDENKVALHMFNRNLNSPSGSPFVLKLETFLRMAGIEYVEDFSQPMSSKGKSPWITFNKEDYADSQFCVEMLSEKLEKDLNKDLSEEQKAMARSFRIMLEDHFYWVVVTLEFVINKGKNVRSVMAPLPVPGFLQGLVFAAMIKNISKQAHAQGTGRHSKEEVEKMGTACLKSLSDYLGNKAFFFGSEPTELDCVAFAFLNMVMSAPEESESKFKKDVEEDFANLKEFFGRMKEKYWADWDEKVYVDLKAKRREEEAARKKEEAEKKKEEKEKKKKEAEEKKKKEEEEKKKKEEEEKAKKEEKKEEEKKEEEKKDEEKKEGDDKETTEDK